LRTAAVINILGTPQNEGPRRSRRAGCTFSASANPPVDLSTPSSLAFPLKAAVHGTIYLFICAEQDVFDSIGPCVSQLNQKTLREELRRLFVLCHRETPANRPLFLSVLVVVFWGQGAAGYCRSIFVAFRALVDTGINGLNTRIEDLIKRFLITQLKVFIVFVERHRRLLLRWSQKKQADLSQSP
jgi:hypothetical protein